MKTIKVILFFILLIVAYAEVRAGTTEWSASTKVSHGHTHADISNMILYFYTSKQCKADLTFAFKGSTENEGKYEYDENLVQLRVDEMTLYPIKEMYLENGEKYWFASINASNTLIKEMMEGHYLRLKTGDTYNKYKLEGSTKAILAAMESCIKSMNDDSSFFEPKETNQSNAKFFKI